MKRSPAPSTRCRHCPVEIFWFEPKGQWFHRHTSTTHPRGWARDERGYYLPDHVAEPAK
jgi:hypothetical protein